MQYITRKRIIAIELILLILTSIVTGQILWSNYQNSNNQNNKNQVFYVQILNDNKDGKVPLEVNFEVKTNLNTNEIIIYQWDFGDGESSSEKNPKHTFEKPGSFQIELRTIDTDGNYYTDNITINVEETSSPEAQIDLSTISGIRPLLVNFYGNIDNDYGIVTYQWEFGPKYKIIVPESKYRHSRFFRYIIYHYRNREYYSDERNPKMVFLRAGTYWAELTITTEKGIKDTDKVWIHVYTPDTYDDD